MLHFSRLLDQLDHTTSADRKVAAMIRYFAAAEPADAAWALFFLSGRRLKRLLPTRTLRDWAGAATGLPAWLLEDSFAVVGDRAETVALVLDLLPACEPAEPQPLATWLESRIIPLRSATPDAQRAELLRWWRTLDRQQRLVLLKILAGELRAGVSQTLVVRALAQAFEQPVAALASGMAGDWTPSADWFSALVAHDHAEGAPVRPFLFLLPSPLDGPVESLGAAAEWIAEWHWDGIRAQIVRRGGQVSLWACGDEIITGRCPEIAAAATRLPDGTVLDGEVLAFAHGRPLPVEVLQQRRGARSADAVPIVYMAYDLLEDGGRDLRQEPLIQRRARLVALFSEGGDAAASHGSGVLRVSEILSATSWAARAAARQEARTRGVSGLMLKRAGSTYGADRRGEWLTWAVEPHAVHAVLVYAQPGHRHAADLLTDCTFGLWHAGELVPVARTHSGMTRDEHLELDRWIRRHSLERFGPVRHVPPAHVFQIGFDAVIRSARRRSGVAVRAPRILRWRRDMKPEEADSLDALTRLLRPDTQ